MGRNEESKEKERKGRPQSFEEIEIRSEKCVCGWGGGGELWLKLPCLISQISP